MNEVGQLLLGERGFYFIQSDAMSIKTPFRNVMSLSVHRAGSTYYLLMLKERIFASYGEKTLLAHCCSLAPVKNTGMDPRGIRG